MIGSAFAPFAAWALLHGAMFAPNASAAAALYFEKAVVKTKSEATCMRFARDVARNQHFTNGHASGAEVAGEVGGAYVAITCVGRGAQPALAVVMSVAPDFAVARRVGQQVANGMKAITCIDQPC